MIYSLLVLCAASFFFFRIEKLRHRRTPMAGRFYYVLPRLYYTLLLRSSLVLHRYADDPLLCCYSLSQLELMRFNRDRDLQLIVFIFVEWENEARAIQIFYFCFPCLIILFCFIEHFLWVDYVVMGVFSFKYLFFFLRKNLLIEITWGWGSSHQL